MASETGNSEWRHDSFTGRSVIIARSRGSRPGASPVRQAFQKLDRCPFCLGHEDDSPIELANYLLRESKNPWDLRVVRNLYPALTPEAAHGFGFHEVIIESPLHNATWAEMSIEQMALIIQAWQERLRLAYSHDKIQHAVVFKNAGPAAGASLQHPHSQLLAMDRLPPDAIQQSNATSQFVEWRSAQMQAENLVYADAQWATSCPPVSRFAGECSIFPMNTQSCFLKLTNEETQSLTKLIRRQIQMIHQVFDSPDYNVIVYCNPKHLPYHAWRMEIVPRITTEAGFEWATGCHINTLPPEEAARLYRDLL
jgi:UDPglucose--hexose-1-phosphate uridylyltransferase